MPVLGLGVWQTGAGEATRQAVTWALEAGYRHIDTATLYQNEREVGEAIRASPVSREEIFVTTKLWHSEMGRAPAIAACQASLERLGLKYVDLYLIHWPRAASPGIRAETWRGLEHLQREQLCRAVGVSNFTLRHLAELESGFDLVPAVNQVEFHPFLYQRELHEYCQRRGFSSRGTPPSSTAVGGTTPGFSKWSRGIVGARPRSSSDGDSNTASS